jgi:hypothetical protein
MAAGKRLVAGLVLASAAALLPGQARALVSETEVNAAFLPRFARYVTCPSIMRPQPGQAFQICVVGADPFGSALDRAAAGQLVEGHKIVVRRVGTEAAASNCHIAFIQGSKTQPAGQMLAALDGRPVLTVTDARGGSQRGMVHFSMVSGRVRFFIDEKEAARRGLGINSRLLALAVGVRPR